MARRSWDMIGNTVDFCVVLLPGKKRRTSHLINGGDPAIYPLVMSPEKIRKMVTSLDFTRGAWGFNPRTPEMDTENMVYIRDILAMERY